MADNRINESNIYVNMTVTKLTKESIVLSTIHVPHVHCTLGDSYISKAVFLLSLITSAGEYHNPVN